MNSFRDINFKNSLDPNFTSYECIRSCEIQSSTENSLENCLISCEWSPPTKIQKTKFDNLLDEVVC